MIALAHHKGTRLTGWYVKFEFVAAAQGAYRNMSEGWKTVVGRIGAISGE
jgi:hypothetical protein